jgi:hypothetical protein
MYVCVCVCLFLFACVLHARMHPDKYMSVQIDGMDQNKTNVPRFFQKLKSTDAMQNPLGTHIVGACTFGAAYPLLAFIDYGGMYINSGNLVVTQLMYLLRKNFHVRDNPHLFDIASKSTIRPQVLYLQMQVRTRI